MIGADNGVIATYPNLYFLKERKLGTSDQLVLWDWATVPEAEDTYNAEINYVSNAVPYPAFTRVYTIRRDAYEAAPTLQIGSVLTGLLGVNIINGGQNYTQATGTINGKDVAIEFVISGGQIISGVITNEGTGVVATDTIVINGDGSGAVAIPIVQPTTCYLTSQKKQELPQDDPLRNEFVRVIRPYETLPGPFIASTRLDEDGVVVTVNTRRNIAANIISDETLVGVDWTKTTKKGDDNFVAEEVVETRDIPGNNMTEQSVDERDGKIQTVVRVMSNASTITPAEFVAGGTTYTKVESKPISDLVAWKITTTRPVPGNPVVKTVFDNDGDKMTETRTIVESTTITTTITTAGGVYTKTFEDPITDVIAWKVVQVKPTQNTMDSYEVSIPDIIPEEFRATLPITTHEDTLIGTASLPTLGTGDLMRKQEQIAFNTYRLTVRGRAGITLPQVITNKETTSQFGGGDINVTLTLDLFNNLSLDEGLLVLVPSEIRKLDSQVNGLAVKTSKILNDTAWPILQGTHVDPQNGIAIDIHRQTVSAGTTGGLSGSNYVEIRPHDKWKSISISSSLVVESLPEDKQWFSGMHYSFPPELDAGAIIDWAEATCGCSDSFSAVLIANFHQYSGIVKTRITEQFYNGPPPDDVTITQFFPQAHSFGFAWASFCGTTDGNCRTKSGAPKFYIPLCLHDDIAFSVGVAFTWSFPATTPAALPHGSYIMLPPHVEERRFGLFRRILTEVLVP
jgi:hypothetical protein